MKKFICILLALAAAAAPLQTGYAEETADPSPVTGAAIVLNSDRAILLGTLPEGVRVKEFGFLYGTSPDALDQKLISRPVERGSMNALAAGLQPATLYYYQAYIRTSQDTSLGYVIPFMTPAARTWTAADAVFATSDERYNFIFGNAAKYYKLSSPPLGLQWRSRGKAAHRHGHRAGVEALRAQKGAIHHDPADKLQAGGERESHIR